MPPYHQASLTSSHIATWCALLRLDDISQFVRGTLPGIRCLGACKAGPTTSLSQLPCRARRSEKRVVAILAQGHVCSRFTKREESLSVAHRRARGCRQLERIAWEPTLLLRFRSWLWLRGRKSRCLRIGHRVATVLLSWRSGCTACLSGSFKSCRS